MNNSIFINFDKSFLISNNALKRLKKDLKENLLENIDSSKYIDSNYLFDFKKENDNLYVNAISIKDYEKNKQRKELKKKLHNKINNNKNIKIKSKKEMKNLENQNFSKNLIKSYHEIVKINGSQSVISPSDVFENVDKYKNEISMLMTPQLKIHHNAKINSIIKKYYKYLGEQFNIEPQKIDSKYLNTMNQLVSNKVNPDNLKINQNDHNSDTQSETSESEEEPNLVNIN